MPSWIDLNHRSPPVLIMAVRVFAVVLLAAVAQVAQANCACPSIGKPPVFFPPACPSIGKPEVFLPSVYPPIGKPEVFLPSVYPPIGKPEVFLPPVYPPIGTPPVFPGAFPPVFPPKSLPPFKFEEGCCPGKLIEEKIVVNKPVNVPFIINSPVISQKCFKTTDVARNVIPLTAANEKCQTQQTIIKVPTTDIVTQETPLCKKTCTTSEYIIQIPIVETTCTSNPLCKKAIRSQDQVFTTVSERATCVKNTCTQNKVIATPFVNTVCQKFQSLVPKFGTKTVIKPEVIKKCVQLPPYKCLKPVPVSAPLPVPFPSGIPSPVGYLQGSAPVEILPNPYGLYPPPVKALSPGYFGPAPVFGSAPVEVLSPAPYDGFAPAPFSIKPPFPATGPCPCL